MVEMSPLARLLFIGLWNFADDEGRMVYSPTRIKLQILPADSADISALLGEIRGKSLIQVYAVDGVEYLQIVNFAKHQKVDKRTPSKYPAQTAVSAESPRITPPDQGRDQGRDQGKDTSSRRSRLCSMPEGFGISERVRGWAKEKGFENLDAHFEQFASYVKKKQPRYADWDEALMGCIRDDWGGVRKNFARTVEPDL